MPISTNFTQTSCQAHVERTLKGDIQMWHILLLFMIRRQDTVHASAMSVQHQD